MVKRLDSPVPSETGFAFHGAGKPGNDGRDESRPYNTRGITNLAINAGFFVSSGIQETESSLRPRGAYAPEEEPEDRK